jgi:hypothetical protein
VKTRITAVVPAFLLVAAGFVSQVFAQEQSQSNLPTQDINASSTGVPAPTYSADSSIASQQPASQPGAATDGVGPDIKGSSAAGGRLLPRGGRTNPMNCDGPVSFCNIYFGG